MYVVELLKLPRGCEEEPSVHDISLPKFITVVVTWKLTHGYVGAGVGAAVGAVGDSVGHGVGDVVGAAVPRLTENE